MIPNWAQASLGLPWKRSAQVSTIYPGAQHQGRITRTVYAIFVFNAHLDLPFFFLTCAQFALQFAQEMPDKRSVSMCFENNIKQANQEKAYAVIVVTYVTLKQQTHNLHRTIRYDCQWLCTHHLAIALLH